MIVNDENKFSQRGINRAEIKGYGACIFEHHVENGDYEGTCIFISHRSSDKKAALTVSHYIRNCGIDVYIDLDDNGLQLATVKNDVQGIVNHIQDGLKKSTHLLVLLSEDTKESWWVPYEIGYAKKSGKSIASLMLKKYIDDFPDYLKIEKTIEHIDDFLKYVGEVKKKKEKYGGLFYEQKNISLPDSVILEEYIRT